MEGEKINEIKTKYKRHKNKQRYNTELNPKNWT